MDDHVERPELAADRAAGPPAASRRERRRWRRGMVLGVIGTVLVHLAFFLHRSPLPVPEFTPAGPDEEQIAALGGGSELQQVEVRVQREEETPETEPDEIIPIPAPVPDVEVEIEPDDLTGPPDDPGPPVLGAPPGTGTGEGEAEGPETGPGTADGTGAGGGGVAPRPIRVPPVPTGAPASVRGREVAVHVFVNAQGQVIPDSTRLEPPTGNRRYDARLRQHARELLFEPARERGTAVAAWFRYVLEF